MKRYWEVLGLPVTLEEAFWSGVLKISCMNDRTVCELHESCLLNTVGKLITKSSICHSPVQFLQSCTLWVLHHPMVSVVEGSCCWRIPTLPEHFTTLWVLHHPVVEGSCCWGIPTLPRTFYYLVGVASSRGLCGGE